MVGPERRVGRYDLLDVIGRGGAAVVYVAYQRDLRREVAVKELLAQHLDDPNFADRFVEESRLAGAMSHSSIVTVLEFFDHDGVPYIAMEYLPRGSLRPYVGRLSVAQVVGVLESVLAGLSHGESRGVVHRDLKPENLLVAADGRVKIADFGVARAINAATTRVVVTGTGSSIGTPAYMAPEQALGETLTPASDLYSLGIVAWELLTGSVPFESTDAPLAVLYRHVHEPVPPVTEVDPEVDERLAAWIDRMVAKRPADRFQHAEAAWVALEDIVIELLGPRWRREARLGEDPAQPGDRPLTPAHFERREAESGAAVPVLETIGEPPLAAASSDGGGDGLSAPVGAAAGRSTILRPGRRHRPPEAGGAATARPSRRRAMIAALLVGGTALVAGAGTLVGVLIAGQSSHHHRRTTRTQSVARYSVYRTLTVVHNPDAIAVGDGSVWVANDHGKTGSRINATTGSVVGHPPVGPNPSAIAFGNGIVWVANNPASGDGTVSRINGTTGTVVGRPISVGRSAYKYLDSIAVADGIVWVANVPFSPERTLVRINATTGTVIGRPIPLGSQPSSSIVVVSIAVANGAVWVATTLPSGHATVSRVNATTGTVVGRPIGVGGNTHLGSAAIAVGNGSVWVTNTADNTVSRINATTGTVMGHPIPVGGDPEAIAVGNGSVWVTNTADNTVSRINATTDTVVGHPIPVGHQPDAIAVDDGGIWVANQGDNTVSWIRRAR